MWAETVRHLRDFPDAVLSGLDADGYPASARCQPEPAASLQALRLQVPEAIGLQPGPACLLCHSHDDRLWNLRSFVVRGTVERDAQGWLFRPRQFIPGAGIGGLMSYVRFVRDGRRTAHAYLKRRGLPWPRLDWSALLTMLREMKQAPGN